MQTLKAVLLICALLSFAGVTPSLASGNKAGWVDAKRVEAAAPIGKDWLMNGRTFEQQRHSPLEQINASNIDRLGLAWEFRGFVVRGSVQRGIESNPILVDGVLYFSGPWGYVYAVDARTGKSLWTYDPQVNGQYARNACCGIDNRGIAVWKGRVFVGSLDGYLIALDARTGKEDWRADTFVDRHFNYTITGAPHVAGNNILIGNAGADMGARGYVSAYNADTGQLAWRFWAVPGDPKKGPDETAAVTMARKTWSKDTRWDLGGGGNAWDAMAYDPKLGLAYLGLGNGGPHPVWLRSPGGGDNLFVSSIVAVDATTGSLKWYYQETPGDSWDYTATAHMILADIPWHGKIRKVIMQAPKNGIFYVLDRETGELLSAVPYTVVDWTDGVDLKTGRPHFTPRSDYSQGPQVIWPSGAGGHGWQPMSFDPATGYVYIPVYDAPMLLHMDTVPKLIGGAINQGEAGEFPPFTNIDPKLLEGLPKPIVEGQLEAWNPQTGKAAWIVRPLPFVNGGILTTASGLLFQGSTDGSFNIYDSRTGKRLKRIETGTAIMGAPITYELDGVQYIAVMGGAGGPQNAVWAPNVAAAKYQNFDRLMVFKLGGGKVPLPPKAEVPPTQPTPELIQASSQTRARGEALFKSVCQRCHVVGGGFGAFPNLWNMSPGTLANFENIVYGGAYVYGGMAAFSDDLTKDDVAAIKAFIVDDEIEKRAQGNAAGAHSRDAYH